VAPRARRRSLSSGTRRRARNGRSGPGYAALEAALAARNQPSGRLATGDRFASTTSASRCSGPTARRCRPSRRTPDRHQQRLDRPARLVRRSAVPPHGDIEEGIDPILVARGLPRVDLLKVAHHGSRTATSEAFLAATRPAIALVSVGAGNTFGHPAPATLARLTSHGIATYRTDLQGSLDVALDGTALDVRTGRARAPAPTRARRPDDATTGSNGAASARVASPSRMIGGCPFPAGRRRRPPPVARATAWHLRHVRAVAEVAGWLALRAAVAGISSTGARRVRGAPPRRRQDAPCRRRPRALPHGARGAAWLAARGHASSRPPWRTTRVASRRADTDAWLDRATVEELFVAYADKRAGQRLVPMAARFAEWTRRYPEGAEWHGWTGEEADSVRRRARGSSGGMCVCRVTPAAVRRLAWTGRALAAARLRSRARSLPAARSLTGARDVAAPGTTREPAGAPIGYFWGDDGYGLEAEAAALAARSRATAHR